MTDTKKPMSFSRKQAKLLGMISWAPCCWTVLFMILMGTAGQSELAQKIMAASLVTTFIVVNITTLVLIIYYIVLISREADLTSNQKYNWGWIVFLFHVMAFPFVWYKFVWSKMDQLDSSIVEEIEKESKATNRKRLVWMGILSWSPIIWIILFIGSMIVAGTTGRSPDMLRHFIVPSVLCLNIIGISMVVYSCILINKDQGLTSEKKYNWYWAVFLLNIFVFPVIWYKFVWKRENQPLEPEMAGTASSGIRRQQ